MSDHQTVSFLSHCRAAFGVALALALCQVMIETLAIAAASAEVLLSPAALDRQRYDFCVKTVLALSSGGGLIGPLDGFLPVGFGPKLAIVNGLLLPNAIVLGGLALLFAGLGAAIRRPPSAVAVLWMFALTGVAVHVASISSALVLPKQWSLWVFVRHVGRVVVKEGAGLALFSFVLAVVASSFICRTRFFARWGLPLAAGATAAVAMVVVALRPVTSSATQGGAGKIPAAKRVRVDNVLLISIDSLRADRLGCYGNARATSPALDALAAAGTRFSEAMSTTSWTLPSHMSMLTGRDVLSHGVIGQVDRLSTDIPTLAETLQAHGIMTGGIVSALFLKGYYGFERGFVTYDDETIPAASWRDELGIEPAPMVVEAAQRFLHDNARRRFFLFLHFWDVHYDYAPPAPYDRMFDSDYAGTVNGVNFMDNPAVRRGMAQRDLDHLLALYDGEIRWVDDHIVKLLATLDALGLNDRTAVIVTADHGDEFFEHGFKGHQRTLYREVVQVPLIMRVPGLPAGRVVNEPVSLVDIAPTILDLLGVPQVKPMDGMTLVGLASGDTKLNRPLVQSWLCNPRRKANCLASSYSKQGWLIHHFQPGRIEFYLSVDAAQQTNMAGTENWGGEERLAELHAALDSRWAQYREVRAGSGLLRLDDAVQQRLRDLGY